MKLNLFYQKTGQGPDLVILHGLFGQSDNWASIAKMLEKDFSVYLVDQRNHGRSPHDNVFNYEAMAEDLLSLSLPKFSIIGHSMGGKTAMFFAKKYPHLVEKLVVVDIGTKYYPVHHQEIIDALKGLDIKKLTSRNEADDQLKEKIADFGTRQFLLKNLYRKEDNSFGWRFNLDVIADQIENVGQALDGDVCEVESLFINGAKSRYIKGEDRPGILKHFTKAKFETIADAGHWVHAEQPDLLVKALLAFFK